MVIMMNIYECERDFTVHYLDDIEIHEWQFSLFFAILSEKFAIFCVISREIAKITGIWGVN